MRLVLWKKNRHFDLMKFWMTLSKYLMIGIGLAGALCLPAAAGNPQDGFVADLDAEIYASIAVQPDGKILIGGVFTEVGGVERLNLARLNPDGSLDTTFDPAPDGEVRFILVQEDGKILIGGLFENIAGGERARLARLNSNGSLDEGFQAECNARVEVIKELPQGQILIAGEFTSVNGVEQRRIARLNANGGVDENFTGQVANGIVIDVAELPDGKLMVCGNFTTVADIGRQRLARLHPNGDLDETFTVNSDGTVRVLIVQANGGLILGGAFNQIAGEDRTRLARLRPDGSLDLDFPQASGGTVYSFHQQKNGGVLIAGAFGNVGGLSRPRLARLKADGTLDEAFQVVFNNAIFAVTEQADGKILAGGRFTEAVGLPRLRCARLYPDGTLDKTLETAAAGPVRALAAQPDGQVFVGGDFNTLGGLPWPYLARLRGDGSVNPAFAPAPNGPVRAIAALPNGQVLAGGAFTHIGGAPLRLARLNASGNHDPAFTPELDGEVLAVLPLPDGGALAGGAFSVVNGESRPGLARLLADGSLEPGYAPQVNGAVHALARLPDGRVFIGGEFTEVNGFTRHHLARLRPDGSLDTTFTADTDGVVLCLLPLEDGRVLAGGDFGAVHGAATGGLVRLNADGGLDASFESLTDGAVRALTRQSDGGILCAGDFTGIAGVERHRLARLDADGAVDPDFDPDADGSVHAVVLLDDGKVLAGGAFATVGGLPRAGLARLGNGAAARFLTLDADGLSLAWESRGTGPRLEAAVFELAVPGQPWQLLGAGVFDGGAWKLRTSALPRGEPFRVRVSGRLPGAAPGSLHETVAQFHLPPLEGPVLVVEQPEGWPLRNGEDVADFGDALPGAAVARQFILRNIGTEPVQINDLNVTGAGFALVLPPVINPVPPGFSTFFVVGMAPEAVGPLGGLVSFESNDAGASPFQIPLTGNGRFSGDARLADLQISEAGLKPLFDYDITGYTLTVPFAVDTLTLTPAAVHEAATIRVNGAVVASGASAPVALSVGGQMLEIQVTAQDGATTRAYTLTVTRLARFAGVSVEQAKVARPMSIDLKGGWTLLSVSGLPRGLRFDAATGTVSGSPQRAGTYTLKVRVRDADGRVLQDTLTFTVDPLPESAVGVFAGFGGPHGAINGGLGGWLQCKVTASGAASGKLISAGKTFAFRGQALSDDSDTVEVTAVANPRSPLPLEVQLTLAGDNRLTGSVKAGTETWEIDEGWRRVWQRRQPVDVALTGAFNTLLELPLLLAATSESSPAAAPEPDPDPPQGAGYARLTVSRAGDARWRGKTADNSTFTFSGFLGPGGETALWCAQHRRTGSLRLSAALETNGDLDGSAHWLKKPATKPKERLYPDGFGTGDSPVMLEVKGGRWQKPAGSATVLGWSASQLVFTGASVESSIGPSPSMQSVFKPKSKLDLPRPGSPGNGAFLTVKISPSNGGVSGKFKLSDFNPERPATLLARPVRFEGLLVPRLNRGAGFFLMEQLAEPPLTTKRTTPILSGHWEMWEPE